MRRLLQVLEFSESDGGLTSRLVALSRQLLKRLFAPSLFGYVAAVAALVAAVLWWYASTAIVAPNRAAEAAGAFAFDVILSDGKEINVVETMPLGSKWNGWAAMAAAVAALFQASASVLEAPTPASRITWLMVSPLLSDEKEKGRGAYLPSAAGLSIFTVTYSLCAFASANSITAPNSRSSVRFLRGNALLLA